MVVSPGPSWRSWREAIWLRPTAALGLFVGFVVQVFSLDGSPHPCYDRGAKVRETQNGGSS